MVRIGSSAMRQCHASGMGHGPLAGGWRCAVYGVAHVVVAGPMGGLSLSSSLLSLIEQSANPLCLR
eukprot:scaffold27823_cov129-Isochrysis_galbana.AAC.1